MLALLGPVGAFIGRNKIMSGIVGFLAVLVLIMGSYFLGSHNGDVRRGKLDAAAMQVAINEALKRNTAALEKASAQRRIDDAAVAARTKGLANVIAHEPDGSPTTRSVILTCERLRLEGHPYAEFPECAGLASRPEAAH